MVPKIIIVRNLRPLYENETGGFVFAISYENGTGDFRSAISREDGYHKDG